MERQQRDSLFLIVFYIFINNIQAYRRDCVCVGTCNFKNIFLARLHTVRNFISAADDRLSVFAVHYYIAFRRAKFIFCALFRRERISFRPVAQNITRLCIADFDILVFVFSPKIDDDIIGFDISSEISNTSH